MAHYRNYLKRARIIKDLVDAEYEVGNSRKNLRMIWRRSINPRYPMCERAFRRVISIMAAADGQIGRGSGARLVAKKPLPQVFGDDPRQTSLNFDE